jgi:very-short-patch-repair endonuclease
LKQAENLRKRDARVPRARRMRHEPTDAERVLWQHLRHLSIEGSHFRRQATIGPYFADFACHAARLVIELDGGQHNEARDARRTAELNARGYCILRFWNNDVLGNVEGVMEAIAAAVRSAGPPPPTPPRHASHGGRGDERATFRQSKRRVHKEASAAERGRITGESP